MTARPAPGNRVLMSYYQVFWGWPNFGELLASLFRLPPIFDVLLQRSCRLPELWLCACEFDPDAWTSANSDRS